MEGLFTRDGFAGHYSFVSRRLVLEWAIKNAV